MTKPLNLRPGLNGNSAESLMRQRDLVYGLRLALGNALSDALPHARNYQHLPREERDDRMAEDRQVWADAMESLRKVEAFADGLMAAAVHGKE